MIERECLADKPQRLIEAKYKYLADFNRNQLSPNLKKHYHDNFSKYSNSQDRRSPSYNSSKRKSSYKKSFQRVSLKKRAISPSCSTFNPRRQITLDEFSPYDQKVDKAEQNLNRQLIQQNEYLKNQLRSIQDKLNSVNLELNKRQTEALKVRELHQCDVKYYEKVVNEMTNQIQIVLTKNKMLENQLTLVKNKLHDEYRRQDQYQRGEQERRKVQQYKRRQQLKRKQYFERSQEYKRVDQRKSSTSQGLTKRSVGKLMVRPLPNASISDHSLGTSKIKIEEETQYINQSTSQNFRPNIINNCDKENKKGDELISSIRSMQLKIAGDQSSSLKQLWKWLKGIGHTHSCFKRWKGKALQACNTGGNDKLKVLIQEACGYVQ